MNQETQQRTWGPLTIIGLILAIIVLAWLAVMVVRFIPIAFTSLATLADRVHESETQTLAVDATHDVVNNGVSLDITWSDLDRAGTYAFSFACASGVSAELRTAEGDVIPLACDTPFMFGDDTFATSVRFMSERDRFADVVYRITFMPERGDEFSAESIVTVVNGSIPLADATDDNVVIDDTHDTDGDSDTVATTTQPTEQPVQYRYVKTVTYTTPVSDPNGYTDLAVTYESIGSVRNGLYTPRSELEAGEEGAFRFEVKNIGTKTSSSWRFEAVLPTGERYRSELQEALKPQERARITVAFDSAGSEGTARISAEVTGGPDQNRNNNDFSWSVNVSD